VNYIFSRLIKLLESHQRIKNLSEDKKELHKVKIKEVYDNIKKEKANIGWTSERYGSGVVIVKMPYLSFTMCDDVIRLLELADLDCYEVDYYRKSKMFDFKCTRIND